MIRKSRLIFGSVTLGVAAVLAAILLWNHFWRDASPGMTIGGPFKLASAKGGIVDSEELRGHPYGVFFGFTHCPEVCPTTLYEMTETLKQAGDEARDFRLFMITVDPERDTASLLKEYVGNFDPRMEGLVPTLDELKAIARVFRAYYDKQPTSDGSYTMSQTTVIYLMDRDGNFVTVIPYGDTPEGRLDKMRKLLGKAG
jgi:protein SCO1/2